MKRSRFAPAAFALLVFSLACIARAADEDDVDHTGIGAVPEQLKKLLPVAIQGKRLILDQDAWEKSAAADSPEQRKKVIAERLAKRMHTKVENVPPQMIDGMLNQTGGMVPVDIFQSIMDEIGGGMGGSSSSGGRTYSMNYDGRDVHSSMNVNMNSHEFETRLSEKIGSKRVLAVSDDKQLGFSIRYANASKNCGFSFIQSPAGPVSLAAYDGKKGIAFTGEDFLDLLHKDPQGTQQYFIKPLMGLGLDFPFSRNHPAVKAFVATGFNAAAPDVAAKVQGLLKTLEDEDQDVREKAFKDLLPLYPQAIFELSEALKTTQDPEVKRRLETIAGNYPDLQLAREFVLLEKLHENREYLTSLLKDPAYKAGVRARLTTLAGKDYGEDPAAWPKQ